MSTVATEPVYVPELVIVLLYVIAVWKKVELDLSNAYHGENPEFSVDALATYVPCPYPLDKDTAYEVMAAGGNARTPPEFAPPNLLVRTRPGAGALRRSKTVPYGRPACVTPWMGCKGPDGTWKLVV
jgi:hypothetical protein